MKKTFILLCTLVFVFQLFGQEQKIEISPATSSSSSYNILYPTYFDPANIASQPELFRLNVKNITEDETLGFVLVVSLTWRDRPLVTGNEITPQDVNLNYPLEPGLSMQITNRDLITNSPDFFDAVQNWDDILNINSDFKDLVLNMGRFPDGVYTFTFHAEESTTRRQISEPLTITINLRSPNPITLITPGSPLGFGVSKVMDNQPYFVWFSNLNSYILRVWELQHTNYSVQQIEGMTPYIETGLATTSFSIPAESALENNKIYAWQVSGEIETPAMTNPTYEKSNVYLFEVTEEQPSEQDNQLLIQLLHQFSMEEAVGLEELIKLLEGGFELKEEDYNRIMQMLSEGKKIKSIAIE